VVGVFFREREREKRKGAVCVRGVIQANYRFLRGRGEKTFGF
jgi:hypothetical protein